MKLYRTAFDIFIEIFANAVIELLQMGKPFVPLLGPVNSSIDRSGPLLSFYESLNCVSVLMGHHGFSLFIQAALTTVPLEFRALCACSRSAKASRCCCRARSACPAKVA